jgi:hypothetical protein
VSTHLLPPTLQMALNADKDWPWSSLKWTYKFSRELPHEHKEASLYFWIW